MFQNEKAMTFLGSFTLALTIIAGGDVLSLVAILLDPCHQAGTCTWYLDI
jgi:hypothetical protein